MIRPRTLLSLLVLLPLAAAITALVLVLGSSDRSLGVLEGLVATVTPYRLSLEDAHISWLPLRFEARQLVLEYPDDTKPALLQARGLQLVMPLSGLWAPRYDAGRFRADSLTYYLDDEGSDEPLDLESLLSPLAWLPARVEADTLHLVSRGERVRVLPLLSLRGERTTAGSLAVDARSYLGQRSITLDALLDWRAIPGGHAVDLVARLHDDTSTLALEGHIEAVESRLTYDVDLRGAYAHAEVFWRLLALPEAAPDAELAIDGRLAGDRNAGVLTLRNLRLVAPERFDLDARGELGLDGSATLRIDAGVADLPALLEATGVASDGVIRLPRRAELRGDLSLDSGRLRLSQGQLALDGAGYAVAGPVDLFWQDGVLSIRDLDLHLSVPGQPLTGTLRGTVADVGAQRGLLVQVDLEEVGRVALQQILKGPVDLPPELTGSISLRVLKAADVALAQDIDARIAGTGGLRMHLQGQGRMAPTREADLEVVLTASEPARAFAGLGLPLGPERGTGRIRLRERYATVLADLERGSSQLQVAVNADLAGGAVDGLRVDVYAPAARLEDFTRSDTARDPSVTTEGQAPEPRPLPLPAWPLTVTLRAGQLQGQRSTLDDVSIEVEADGGDLILRHFDARYAGGELMLRGLAHLQPPPRALSLGGRGIRVPLGAITQDLGLQKSITGELSFRGALTARGDTPGSWTRTLAGQAGIVIGNAVVSGGAYDLLMSNLLAWLVQGAGEHTTTFDCTLLDFEVRDGVAESRVFLVDTPRMRAEGQARIDFAGDRIDLRLEPRSKDRLVQFPSAVRLRGPLSSPRVDVSGLQATADLSAQALLLLPSLPLKLLGLGADGKAPQPCVMPAPP